jgi:hypothetical protein
MPDQNRAWALECKGRIERTKVITSAISVEESKVTTNQASFAFRGIGANDIFPRQRSERFDQEGQDPDILIKAWTTKLPLTGRMKLHECGNDSRQFVRDDLANSASAPPRAILRGPQILPLMCRSIFEGVVGRTKYKLRSSLGWSFVERARA